MSLAPHTRVRLTQAAQDALVANGCAEHVAEFGGCEGVVEGPVAWSAEQVGPEVNVRWAPSGLRYAYHPDELARLAPPDPSDPSP
jgi:hypothetical protein